jgi:hypothetical protein
LYDAQIVEKMFVFSTDAYGRVMTNQMTVHQTTTRRTKTSAPAGATTLSMMGLFATLGGTVSSAFMLNVVAPSGKSSE